MLPELINKFPSPVSERIRIVRNGENPAVGQYVMYWMHNALRAEENPALDAAILAAEALQIPLFVYQGLSQHYPYASDRLHAFIFQGACDVQKALEQRGIGYVFHLERPGHMGDHLRTLASKAALLVTEDLPVDPIRGWLNRLEQTISTPIWAVDTACVVPMLLSRKAPDRAYRFRDATRKLYAERLTRAWQDASTDQPPFVPPDLPFTPVDLANSNLTDLLSECEIDHGIAPVPHTWGGSNAGYARWQRFKESGLSKYARRRNDASLLDGVSRMSAYLHFGMVSPMRIAREAADLKAEKYLDELLIWRELAYHFCFHTKELEDLSVIPDWARQTLQNHQSDPRPALHSWETLARGVTADELWNLAQRSLLVHGELHNNIRMTWGKAFLQWTANAETALKRMIDLNHRYALDGRDPASYGGLLWCLGLFDRPFEPEENIIGKVRPRPTATHANRLNLPAYRNVVQRPLVPELPKIAVVGAGMAGLFCARTLQDHGLSVMVFDKGRGVGGRLSTRRYGNEVTFDHGAQYFTVRDDRFRRYVDSWVEVGLVAQWQGRIVSLAKGIVLEEKSNTPRFVGVPGMNAIGKHLANGLSVRLESTIAAITKNAQGWQLRDVDDHDLGVFDRVIVSAPPEQTATLTKEIASLSRPVAEVTMKPCWAVMAVYDQQLSLPFDGAFVQDSPLSWIARNSNKPGRDDQFDCWVWHASAEWSEDHLEDQADTVSQELLRAIQEATGINERPSELIAHRWRYAIPPEPLHKGHLADETGTLIACGDWCSGARVEGAFLSGMSAAGKILRSLLESRVETEPELVQQELF